jgi:serine-type D-Ala-D-Ala carboxypeptidase/endopeptidase
MDPGGWQQRTVRLLMDRANPYASYSVEHLYRFLSRHKWRRDVGAQAGYSNVGPGLLGYALALRGD